jgi:hypothetical protein
MDCSCKHIGKVHPPSDEMLEKIQDDFYEELSKRINFSGESVDLPPIEETEAYKKFVAAGLS